MTRSLPFLGLIGIVLLLVSGVAQAQQAGPRAAPVTIVQSHTLPPIGTPVAFDPAKATEAYLARVSGTAKARSDSYFEGGYWLILLDTLWAIALSALLLWTRFSAALRDFAERQTRSAFWQVPLYVGPYVLIATALSFPLTLYEGFLRERAYGLMNQTFFGWFLEFLTVTGVNLDPVHHRPDASLLGDPRRGTDLVDLGDRRLCRLRRGRRHHRARAARAADEHIHAAADSPLKHDILSLARANGIRAKTCSWSMPPSNRTASRRTSPACSARHGSR